MMSLDQNHSSQVNAWREFQKAWKYICDDWDDKARHRFEQEYWSKVNSTVPSYLTALDDLNKTINQARHSIH